MNLPDALTADAVRVDTADQLPAAVAALGLHQPRPTVVVVGGADGLDDAGIKQLRALFVSGIVPVAEKHGAVGVDGGTRVGVMRLFGEARATGCPGSFAMTRCVRRSRGPRDRRWPN